MRRRRRSAGYTIVEMMLGVFISLIVVYALGKIITQSQKSWSWGQDKTRLQQNTTETLEWMARSVRAARSLKIISNTEFSTRDTTGTVVHNYKWMAPGDSSLRQDGVVMVDRICRQFRVKWNADTTSVTLKLRLVDTKKYNQVADSTRATVRNRIFEF
jgi:hypothetical protein